MLGSGPTKLGSPIDWTLDFKSNTRWSMRPSLKLPVNDLGNPSDIKVPWELSRLQWLLPVGQAYVLDQDEEDAEFARDIVVEWMRSNPVCTGPNWICAMDVALRAISMVWLYQACKHSDAWSGARFLEEFVKQLILHGKFIDSNLEYTDVNGNHLTADLAGLTIIGVALGGEGISKRWVERSWRILNDEIFKQVGDDGVCFEASLPYHRLVAELFLLPALARQNVGLPVSNEYRQRLRTMGAFTACAIRPDGHIPIWGDADDGRGLPLGTQEINDHRYLPKLLATMDKPLSKPKYDETLWWLGSGNSSKKIATITHSSKYENAGAYIMRREDDYVFIDAGPVGMAGRGGHGHNDCLSFEAALLGERLIVDPGCYVYTSDWQARNRFRGTAAHNTPFINNQEINRITRDAWLWYLEDDARPDIRHWSTSDDLDMLIASHSGYQRLHRPVTPIRQIVLEKSTHRLIIADGFEGDGEHAITTTLTFAPGVSVELLSSGVWQLSTPTRDFQLVSAMPESWGERLTEAEYSPSYGVKETVQALVFERTAPLAPLVIAVIPEDSAPPDSVRWLKALIADRLQIPGISGVVRN